MLKTRLQIRTIIITIIIITSTLSAISTNAQIEKKRKKTETEKVEKEKIKSLPDSVYKFKHDTITYIKDKIDYSERNGVKKSNAFYDSVYAKTRDKKLTKALYGLALRKPKRRLQISDTIITSIESPFIKYAGKIIRNIQIIKLKPFGTDISDTTFDHTGSKLENFGNSLHIMTRTFVIKNNLIIKKGEEINPIVLADNERILRELPYIEDARIQVINCDPSSDSVDILVIAKDKFDLAFNPVIKNAQKFSLKIWTVNFLGSGHRFENKFTIETNRDPVFRYDEGNYKIDNIKGTFIKGLFSYKTDNTRRKEYEIGFTRDLSPPTIKNSYGLVLKNTSYPGIIPVNDSLTKKINIKYSIQNFYYTRAFPLGSEYHVKKFPLYLLPSIRVYNINYLSRPFSSADSNLGYRNKTTLLAGISIAKNNYFITNYFYGFGTTEDIPYGYFIQFIGGYEIGEYFNRPYAGLQMGTGKYINQIGYYNINLKVGSYFRNNKFEQGVFEIAIDLASRLYHLRQCRLRNYLEYTFIYGFMRWPGENIYLNDLNGMHGLGNNDLTGQKRIILTFESQLFTPIHFYGFNFALYAFTEFGMLIKNNTSLFRNCVYTGLGLGIRIKNENLVFRTLQLEFIYFPNPPSGINEFKFISSGIPDKELRSFYPGVPGILGF